MAKAKAKAKSGTARRDAKKVRAVAKPARSKPKNLKRATPIKQSSKLAKKAAPRKSAKSSVSKVKPVPRRSARPANAPIAHKPVKAAAAHKPVKAAAAHKPVKAAAQHKPVKASTAHKPAPKKAVVKKAVHSHVAAKRPAPVKSVPAKPQPHKRAESDRGGVAFAAPGSEPGITKEDGHYALPATITIDFPKGYRPSSKEEYMSPRQLAYFRNKLRDWRDQLVDESRQTMENLREEVRDVGDDAERATRETENSLELRTRDRYRKLISKIDKALRRIEEGRYGFCEETDEEIGIDRLEARPIATLSLDAQERREHLQKQMGE